MTVRCPAKVNLFLSVGPPDPSGYHPIRTVLQSIGIFDDLEIAISNNDSLVCDGLVAGGENTVAKALRLIREALPIPPLDMTLTKRIPTQAGLGGGSSDAAGLIRYVLHGWPDLFSSQFAHEVAFAVGADVPFFLVGGAARGTGYGEVLQPLPDQGRRWAVVVKPEIGVSTPDAYARLDASPRPWKEFSDEAYNDFERVAPCASLELAVRLTALGATRANLCGSGSAVFGLWEEELAARSAATRLTDEGNATWVAPTLTREESLWT